MAMASIPAQIPHGPWPDTLFRLSVAQYHAMIEAGVLGEDDPVELLEGVLVFKMPKKPKHAMAMRLLTTALDGILKPGVHFWAQEPVTLADGEPEPDGAVVRGDPRDYTQSHPGAGDILMILEVADTTLVRDRGIKLRSYARSGIKLYWIVNLIDQCVEVYTHPVGTGDDATYGQRRVFGSGQDFPIELDAVRQSSVAVSQILP